MNLYTLEIEEDRFLYYYGSVRLPLDSFKTPNDTNGVSATIEFVKIDGDIFITWLESKIQGKGYASRLLNICKDIVIESGTDVYVDDCSDRYRCEHNIYIKEGFAYVNDDGPEMKFMKL